MFVVVAYDISDDALRERLHKTLRRYGDAVQCSVFECVISESQFRDLRESVARLLEPSGETGVRYYGICEACRRETRTLGRARTATDQPLYLL
jgi:CRISPR-associated protein Cas2